MSLIKVVTKKTYDFARINLGNCLKMDVYTPVKPRDDRACVVYLHGGGFVDGSRDDKQSVEAAYALAERGFVVVCPDYQLGMQNREMVEEDSSILKVHKLLQYCIDLAVEDLEKAIDYLWLRCNELQIDANKIILTGSSMGAIVALQLDYYRVNKMQSYWLANQWRPAAVVAYSGAVLANHFTFGYDKQKIAPTLLFHGLKDKIVEPGMKICSLTKSMFGSSRLYKAMTRRWLACNSLCWMFRVENARHEVSTLLPETIDLFCAFVEEALARRCDHVSATVRSPRVKCTEEWCEKTFLELFQEKLSKIGPSK